MFIVTTVLSKVNTLPVVLLKYIIIFWPNDPYYAGITLDAFGYLLCSKLCWHNRLIPTAVYIKNCDKNMYKKLCIHMYHDLG